MAQTEFARLIAVSLELAGYADRGLDRVTPEAIRDQMGIRDVPEEHFHDVMLLTDALWDSR